jgi:TnpA family transposase
MNITEQEKHIVSLFRKLPSEESQTEIIKAWCQTGRDINKSSNVSKYIFL